MKEFYLKPISEERFAEYLSKLQGDTKGDMILPISGYNPMAKNHVLQKIHELEELQAESIILEVIEEVNRGAVSDAETYKVVLNLADDFKGAWTNKHTTDYESKFKINALVSRKFCAPYFWTTEQYTRDLVFRRTKEYLSRTRYRQGKGRLVSLEDHFLQEVFVGEQGGDDFNKVNQQDFLKIATFYKEHKKSEDYDLIFNFFYGDDASASLAFRQFGIRNITGFEYAKLFAQSKHIG